MTTNLLMLEKELEDLKKNPDAPDRHTRMRSLRKQIRKLRTPATSAVTPNETHQPKKKKTSTTKGYVRRFSEEEALRFFTDLEQILQERLEKAEHEVLQSQPTFVFASSMIREVAQQTGHEPKAIVDALITKFSKRWGTFPTWYTITYQGDQPLYCLGPIPQ